GQSNIQRFKDRATGVAVGLGFRINPGASAVVIDNTTGGSSNVDLRLGKISQRQIGGSVDFTPPAGTQSYTGTSGGNAITVGTNINVNGILGGFATVSGTDWAITGSSGTTPITPLAVASYVSDTWAAGNNTNVTTS